MSGWRNNKRRGGYGKSFSLHRRGAFEKHHPHRHNHIVSQAISYHRDDDDRILFAGDTADWREPRIKNLGECDEEGVTLC